MLKLWTLLWIVLTLILIAFPIWFLAFFFSRRLQHLIISVWERVSHASLLHTTKLQIPFLSKKPSQSVSLENQENTHEEVPSSVLEEPKKALFDRIPLVHSGETPEESLIDASIYDRQSFLKNKKLLEKIIYEALVLRKEGRFDEYEKKLIEWLALESTDKDLNKLLADYYFSIDNHKKALSLLKRIVEIDPKDHKAIWQIGEIYLTSGDFETAELLIEKAIVINPANPKYYVSMVELYYNTDRKPEAIQKLEQVVRLRPTNPGYMLTLADLYLEVDDLDNAKKYYFRVLEHEPSNEKAKKRLKDLVKE